MDSLLGLLTLLFGAAFVATRLGRHRDIAAPIVVAFALRAFGAVIDVYFYRLPGAGDGQGWDRVATYWARNGLEGTLEYVRTGHTLYVWLMSVLYAIFDRSRLMIQGINVLLGTLMVIAASNLGRELSRNAGVARRVAWIVACFPSLIFFSSVLLREVAVAYPLTLSVLHLTRWYNGRRPYDMLVALFTLLTSMAFHSGGLAVLLVAGLWVVGNWIKNLLTLRFHHFGRHTIALLAGVGAIILVLTSGFGLQKFDGFETGDMSVLVGRQDGFAHGRAVYLQDLRADSPAEVVLQAPIRVIYFLFAPFPWMLSEVADAFGVVDSALFVFLVVRLLLRRKALAANTAAVMVVGTFAAMATMFAMGVSNYGTALRHRNKMLPMLVAAAAAIPAARRRQQPAELPMLATPRVT